MRRFAWGTMVVLATLVALYALSGALLPGIRSPFVADLFDEKTLRAFAHLGGGGVALLVGAFQFSARIRTRRVRLHRRLGMVYLVAAAVGGSAALLLAPVSAGGLAAHYGFGLLAVLWVGTAAMAYVGVRRRDYVAHRAWMIRSYALCLAAVTLRLYLPLSAVAGIGFEQAYPAIAWLCWVPNLVVAEWLVVPGRFAGFDEVAPARSG